MGKKQSLKKKSVTILSTTVLLGTLVPHAFASSSYTDISNSYAKDAILELTNKGIINETGDGKFNPTGIISRQDFAIILAKTLNLDLTSPPALATFSDVPSNSYAFNAVEAAVKAGLVKGLGGGNFGAANTLTREQMAVIFMNALAVDITGKGQNLTFSDASSISDWAKDSVAAALELNLMRGNSDGSFGPKKSALRQEVALVASKFLGEKSKQDIENPSQPATPEPVQGVVIPQSTPIAGGSNLTPTPEPTPTPVPSSTPTPTPEPSSTPTPTPVPSSTPTPTPEPSSTPIPTPVPTPEPTPTPVYETSSAFALSKRIYNSNFTEQPKTFTVSDGVNTATITADQNYEDMRDFVRALNTALTEGHVNAKAAVVDLFSFKIVSDVTGPNAVLYIGGEDASHAFNKAEYRGSNLSGVNEAPTIQDLQIISRDEPTVGDQLLADFDYIDAENDEVDSLNYQWYRSESLEASDKTAISGATNQYYRLTDEDLGSYITLKVTPIAKTGTKTGTTATKTLNQIIKSNVPTVDITKFEVIDNYNSEQDQIRGLAGAVSEPDTVVKAYRWEDLNENGIVDEEDRLGSPINLGLSQSDGSLPAANIGDLDAGVYSYILTSTNDNDNESPRDAEHAFTFTLQKGVRPAVPTLPAINYGFNIGTDFIHSKLYQTGSLQSVIRLDYFTGETFSNGILEVTMEGLTFTTNDYIAVGGWRNITAEEISNGGHTLTIKNISGFKQDVAFELYNKRIPAVGDYLIRFRADADGIGTQKSFSEEQQITLKSVQPL
ncbi:S-layer homology domain-containing protein [Paenibacillus sp. GCM10012306]|uniref:S-layer homology domain-containing protein n=1 Tax=Paenibacillus sp. GCM10012306 TaxID=3317342 RepID=UPI003610EDDB